MLINIRIGRCFEIRSYAFTQYALRELRAHTGHWRDVCQATAPSGLLGRRGQEHIRTMASEMVAGQAHWPFNLSGYSGVRLLNHRASISWRLLALVEFPSLTLSERPTLSKDFTNANRRHSLHHVDNRALERKHR